jgi:Arc/MetJ-type ribon-helix-helix transcriptional regulator
MPARLKNRVGTIRPKLSLDPQTSRVLDDMVGAGIYGKTQSEVASYLIRTWLRENREELKEFGIPLVKKLGKSD